MRNFLLYVYITLLLAGLLTTSCSMNFNEGNYSYHLEKDATTGKVYCPDANYVICLEKDPQKDFVILNLADIQEPNPAATNIKQLIDKLVKTTKPDLITLTGDQSYGSANTIRQLGEILESYQIPWAPILGNHDHNESETSVEFQCVLYENFEHCLFKTGPYLGTTIKGDSAEEVPRAGNYVINIVENSQDDFSVVKTLVFLDSGNIAKYRAEEYAESQHYANGSSWDRLLPAQITFFNQAVSSAGSQDAVLFTHIPIFEYVQAINAALKTDISVYNISNYMSYAKSISYEESCNSEIWNEGFENAYGTLHEVISCSPYDDSVFEAIQENTGLIICGHDHVNSFIVDYKGVTFCYAMKTGPGCYYEEDLNGGTVITINSSGKAKVRHVRITT